MKRRLAVVILFALLSASSAKKFGRCELASILTRNGIPKNKIADWICLATAESSLNSRAINRNKNGSKDYGIFQLFSRITSLHPSNVQRKSTRDTDSMHGTAGRTSAEERTFLPT
ncbi:lysozyme c-1-like isoform X1 [Haemaphysalis longicornis]